METSGQGGDLIENAVGGCGAVDLCAGGKQGTEQGHGGGDGAGVLGLDRHYA